ncbi:PREDICTED: protein EPIDERMAL PATTERNING FACTOR 2-like [Lupinus angustifolius]|uniref:protein EPIDERMAL PATTERNING FACTOR 2-like n=1 Tax=Lupinus angustifolius TaxID=3871 RepID=UPI00092F6A16|nr:PREDICTED: protein EPIDERMAL PATTERNING FACTOR 2-like [Lupinus angustifolius]
MMRSSVYTLSVATAFLLLLYVPMIISARHISHSHSGHGRDFKLANTKEGSKVGKAKFYLEGRHATKHVRGLDTLHVAGSRLPDCSHACGSCSPCRLVMVSFVCATIQEAETCPMAYKCMCNNKSYPVP